MDGGGCVLEPLTAGYPGVAAGRSASSARYPAPRNGGIWANLSRLLVSPASALGLKRRRRSFVAVPMARRLPRLTGTLLLLGFFAGTGLYGSVLGGQYATFRAAYGEPRDVAARLFGFGLDRIEISGLSQLSEREILRIAGIDPRLSLPFLNVAEIRERLERTPLIRSASVRKLYPRELSVSLVEREPYALWQKNGELFVTAADGTVIEGMHDPRFVSLPLVVGEGANARAGEYAALLEAAGPLRSAVRAGMLVSGRRWTLKMKSGLDVLLPEEGAPAAVQRLVKLDREQHVLDKDVLAIDLRISDRVVVRLTEEAAAARAEVMKKRPQRGAKGVET